MNRALQKGLKVAAFALVSMVSLSERGRAELWNCVEQANHPVTIALQNGGGSPSVVTVVEEAKGTSRQVLVPAYSIRTLTYSSCIEEYPILVEFSDANTGFSQRQVQIKPFSPLAGARTIVFQAFPIPVFPLFFGQPVMPDANPGMPVFPGQPLIP